MVVMLFLISEMDIRDQEEPESKKARLEAVEPAENKDDPNVGANSVFKVRLTESVPKPGVPKTVFDASKEADTTEKLTTNNSAGHCESDVNINTGETEVVEGRSATVKESLIDQDNSNITDSVTDTDSVIEQVTRTEPTQEKDVGITEYISKHEGFQGVLKQRY